MGDMDCDNQWVAKTLTITQKIHHMAFCSRKDLTKLAIGDLFFFCAFCLDEDDENFISLLMCPQTPQETQRWVL
jgi:hypothetical protein